MAVHLEDMLQELMVIQKNQMGSDELFKARIAQTESVVVGLVKQYDNQDGKIISLTDRMDNLELNEEITDEQVRTIQSSIKSRVSKVLGYPSTEAKKYYRTFSSNLYAHLRHSHNMGSKTATTRKKHYDTVMKGIEAWHPNVQELKDRKDRLDKIEA